MIIILSETKLSDMAYRDVAYVEVKYCDNRDNVIDYEIFDINSNPNNNATNGDMLKTLFPDMKRWEYEDKICVVFSKDIAEIKMFPKSWWNAPYKIKSEEE